MKKSLRAATAAVLVASMAATPLIGAFATSVGTAAAPVVAAVGPRAAEDAAEPSFSDVDEGAWYAGAVNEAVASGLMGGYDDGTFGVGRTLTRAELATILWRELDPREALAYDADAQAATVNETGLSGVDDHAWYTAAANWAARNRIVCGRDGCDFAAAEPVTTEELLTILARAAGHDAGDVRDGLAGVSDANDISPWAARSVAWARSQGVVTGYPEGGSYRIDPASPVTRERAAQILVNALSRSII